MMSFSVKKKIAFVGGQAVHLSVKLGKYVTFMDLDFQHLSL